MMLLPLSTKTIVARPIQNLKCIFLEKKNCKMSPKPYSKKLKQIEVVCQSLKLIQLQRQQSPALDSWVNNLYLFLIWLK